MSRFNVRAMQVGRLLQEATRCPTCGKSRMVLNTAGYRRPYAPEPVTPETHCQCKAVASPERSEETP